MNEICAKDICTGCTACMNICPHNAIKMTCDKYGFKYPAIDVDECVGCNLCKKTCPAHNNIEMYYPKYGYICHAKSKDEQYSSTSGGVMSVMSRCIIKKGGVVYGCSIIEGSITKHIRISNENELNKLKGSKYVQSSLGTIFLSVRTDLKQGNLVLFTGTPCQVAGLKAFLHKDYTNLYTIDFVCHGVPSQVFLEDSISTILEKHKFSFSRMLFRYKHIPLYFKFLPHVLKTKINIKSTYGLHFIDKNGHLVYSELYPQNNYILGFLTGISYRESCYRCKFATQKRVSDMTCGDYYDKEKMKLLPNASLLTSMLSLNTNKAEFLYNLCEAELVACNVNYQDIIESHRQLQKPMKRHPLRNKFLSVYPQKGFEATMDYVMIEEKKRIIRNIQLNRIVKIFCKIPIIRKLRKK